MNSVRIALMATLALMCACQKPERAKDEAAAASGAAALAAGLECSAPEGAWLPATPEPDSGPASAEPEDCFFYKAAWQHFLVATQSDATSHAAFLTYPNIATIFGAGPPKNNFVGLTANQMSVALRDVQRPNTLPSHPTRLVSMAEGVRQAGGLFGLVVDSSGNPVFYSIHVNQRFADFIKTHDLTTREKVEQASRLEFDPGVAEFKAAWVISDPAAPIDPDYIYAEVEIPNLRQDSGGVVRLAPGVRTVRLKLIAFHIAFVIQDHPEFIWATFEHVTHEGLSDVAPSAQTNSETSAVVVQPGVSYTLFAPSRSRDSANSPCPGKAPSRCVRNRDFPVFDEARQSFARVGGSQQTSIFREFPASKSDRWDEEDPSVRDLNISMRSLLAPAGGPRDVRANYSLVGATWLEHPRDGGGRSGDFALGRSFANPAGQDTEDRSRVVAGEDALSSTAMESFTQRDSPGCFSCHDTRAVRSDEDGHVILKATTLNVSHVISRYLSQPE